MEIINDISSVKLNKQVDLFRQFLNSSYSSVDELMEYHDWDNDMDLTLDWIQTNWELLFERELLGKNKYLTPLSVPLSTRVTKKNTIPKYSVNTKISKDMLDMRTERLLPKNKDLRFFGFCSACKEGGFGFYPPFDLANLVLDLTKEIFTVPLSELEFFLVKI